MLHSIVAFSGGKDSTVLVLEIKPRAVLFTPTGNELPGVLGHIRTIAKMVGAEIVCPSGPSLAACIQQENALPNPRMRWCTPMIKIIPAQRWLVSNPNTKMLVGIRADEEHRKGLYRIPEDRYDYPLRRWGWTLKDVESRISKAGIIVPKRTDCAVCPYQRLGEWWRLWKHWPQFWSQGEAWESMTGHTFRMPSRDTWPAAMCDLATRFEAGDKPRGADDEDNQGVRCRVCTL